MTVEFSNLVAKKQFYLIIWIYYIYIQDSLKNRKPKNNINIFTVTFDKSLKEIEFLHTHTKKGSVCAYICFSLPYIFFIYLETLVCFSLFTFIQ